MSTRRWRVDVFLAPGDLVVRDTPANVKTIVGSCVAVCLWDPRRSLGGVNHYLLARPGSGDTPDARFGTIAMTLLLERMRQAGADCRRMRAAVIGGGHPVSVIRPNAIGDDNVDVALAYLRESGIRVARQSTGGEHGRKLLFNTHSGKLLVRDLRGWPKGVPEVARA